jgi:Domain of unknown function (DUF4129)
MAVEGAAQVRPRTTGELLDHAWRLYFADAPVLLLFTGVFLAPAFGALLLLTALPSPANPLLRLLAPLLPLTLLVLTGLGSGACQEWFRTRAERKTPSFTSCLNAAGRRGLSHTASRVVSLAGPLFFLGMALTTVSVAERPGALLVGQLIFLLIVTVFAALLCLALWPFLATIHAYLASGKTHSLANLSEYVRQARYDPTKTAVVTLSRLALLVLLFINLHLLVEAGLWVLTSLAGFDAAFVALQMTLANPVYDLGLALLAWLLLAPFAEASNFLMHMDARTRQEGLDLQIRVQNVFPTAERKRVGALAVLIGVLFFGVGSAHAETVYDAVHATRTAVERIAGEVKTADPYDGAHWEPELRQMATRLEKAGAFGWFGVRIKDFAGRDRNDALRVMDDLDQRLGLLEETLPRDDGSQKSTSKDDLKKLLQQPGAVRPVVDVRPEDETDKPKEEEKPQEIKKDQSDDDSGGGRPHQVLMAPPALAGCGPAGLLLLAGLALAVMVVGAVLFIAARNNRPGMKRAPLVAAKTMQQTTERHEPQPHERPPAELWREADEQARGEQYLQAVRSLYLAVLSMLHRQQLLRFEPTRTNGEYLQQVRLAPQVPAELHTAFGEFTDLFERKWYGDRACDAVEYRACRKLAEKMQTLVREM